MQTFASKEQNNKNAILQRTLYRPNPTQIKNRPDTEQNRPKRFRTKPNQTQPTEQNQIGQNTTHATPLELLAKASLVQYTGILWSTRDQNLNSLVIPGYISGL